MVNSFSILHDAHCHWLTRAHNESYDCFAPWSMFGMRNMNSFVRLFRRLWALRFVFVGLQRDKGGESGVMTGDRSATAGVKAH